MRRFSSAASASALVIGDGANQAVRSAVRAAQACASGHIDVLLTGADAKSQADTAAKWQGVHSVLVAANESRPTAEAIAPLVKSQIEKHPYAHVIAPATTFGKNLLPRISGVLGLSTLSDVIEVKGSSPADTFVRPFYAGNALATVRSTEKIKLLTVRPTAFEPIDERADGLAQVIQLDQQTIQGAAVHARWVSEDRTESGRPDLTSAGVVIAGGRGLKSEENFKMLEDLADELGGAVAATRAAVDAGFVPNDMQVGQTGKVVAPELYIAVGISGAIQHLAGMKDSKTIVAINKDADAPIFQVADYGVVADLFEAVPQFREKIRSIRQAR